MHALQNLFNTRSGGWLLRPALIDENPQLIRDERGRRPPRLDPLKHLHDNLRVSKKIRERNMPRENLDSVV